MTKRKKPDSPKDDTTATNGSILKILEDVTLKNRKKVKTTNNGDSEKNLITIFDIHRPRLIEAEAEREKLREAETRNEKSTELSNKTLNKDEQKVFAKMKTGGQHIYRVGVIGLIREKKIRKKAEDENGDDFLAVALKNNLYRMSIDLIREGFYNKYNVKTYLQINSTKLTKDDLTKLFKESIASEMSSSFSRPQILEDKQAKQAVDLIDDEDDEVIIVEADKNINLKPLIPVLNINNQIASKTKQAETELIAATKQTTDMRSELLEGNDILHLAIYHQIPIKNFAFLCKRGPDLLMQKDALGHTPLYIAMSEDKAEYFEFIYSLRTDQLKEILIATDYTIDSIIGYSVLFGKTGYVHRLLNLISNKNLLDIEVILTTNIITFHQKNYNLITCIALNCHPEFTKNILNKYPKLIEFIFKDLLTALSDGYQQLVEATLSNINKNIDEIIDGRTLLHRAVMNDDSNAAAALIKMGAKPNEKDIWGWSALDVAINCRNNSTIKILKQNGAKAFVHQDKQVDEQALSIDQLENMLLGTQKCNSAAGAIKSQVNISEELIKANLEKNNLVKLNISKSSTTNRSSNYNNLPSNNANKNLNNEQKFSNAFTMSKQDTYQYQYRDMDLISKILVAEYNKNKHENDQLIGASPLNIGRDLDGKITDIKQELQKFNDDLIQNKKIVGTFNCGGNHWLAYTIFKDQNDHQIKCLYKDSLGHRQTQLEQAFGQAFYGQKSIVELYRNHLILSIEGNAEQKLQFEPIMGKEHIHTNCGIFALKNMLLLADIDAENLYRSLVNYNASDHEVIDLNIMDDLEFFSPGGDQNTYQKKIKEIRAEFANKYCYFLTQEAINSIIAKINVDKHSNEATALAGILGVNANLIEICSVINEPNEYLYKINYSQFSVEYFTNLTSYLNSQNINFANDQKSKLLLIKSYEIFCWLDSIDRSSQHKALYDMIAENDNFKPEANIDSILKNQLLINILAQIYGRHYTAAEGLETKNLIANIIENLLSSAPLEKHDNLPKQQQLTDGGLTTDVTDNLQLSGNILQILKDTAGWD